MTRGPSHVSGKSNSSFRSSLSQFKISFEIFYRKEKVLIASLIFFIPITRQPPGSSFMFLLLEAGSSTLSYPMRAASLTILSAFCTARRSPVSPSSPMDSVLTAAAVYYSDEYIASATARSTDVPSGLRPPTMFTYTS